MSLLTHVRRLVKPFRDVARLAGGGAHVQTMDHPRDAHNKLLSDLSLFDIQHGRLESLRKNGIEPGTQKQLEASLLQLALAIKELSGNNVEIIHERVARVHREKVRSGRKDHTHRALTSDAKKLAAQLKKVNSFLAPYSN